MKRVLVMLLFFVAAMNVQIVQAEEEKNYYLNVVSIASSTEELNAENYLEGAVEYKEGEYPDRFNATYDLEQRGRLHIVVPIHKKIFIGDLTFPGAACWSVVEYTIPGVTEYHVYRTGGGVAVGGQCRVFVIDNPDYVSDTPIEVSAITLDSEALNLLEGDTWKLAANITPVFATDKEIVWSTSNASVATVDNGLVTAIGAGTATVTAKAGDKEVACEIVVEREGDAQAKRYFFNVQYVREDLNETNYLIGARRYREIDYPQVYDDKRESPGYLGWLHIVVPCHKKVNIVSYVGDLEYNVAESTLRQYMVGDYRVFVYKTVISDEFGRKIFISDDPDYSPEAPVSNIELNMINDEWPLDWGETFQFEAYLTPVYAVDKNITWSTSDASVAIVDENGLVTAVGAGTAVITAKAGIAEATRIINVSGPSSIVLNFNNVTLDESENFTLIATVDNKDTTGKSVVWSSSNTDVVMVDNTGKVTAVAAGTATITAKAGDKSATCTITVKAKEVVEVPENPEVPKDAFYFWQSAAGTVVETGGVATGHGAGEGRVNYANGDYHTLSISAKKANIDTDYILITLDQPLAANDKLEITAYRNKDTDANGTLYILFENGHVIDEGDNVVWNNIALGQEPNTNTYAVGEGAGSKTIKLSRSKSSTNVFITKFVITRTADGIEEIEMVVPTENTIYNLQGQKIDASSIEALPAGLYIINGKKMVVK